MIPRSFWVLILVLAMVAAELAVPVLWGDVHEGPMVTEQVLAHKGPPEPPAPKDPVDPQPAPPGAQQRDPRGPERPNVAWYAVWAGQVEAGPFLTRETCLPVAARLTAERRRPHSCFPYAD